MRIDREAVTSDITRHDDQGVRRSRATQREETRARLIEAAGIAFADHGYAGASLEMIAAAAGYTKGAVYSNFVSKDALGIAVLDSLMESDRRIVERILERFAGVRQVSVAVADEFASQESDARTTRLRMELLMQAGRDRSFSEAVGRLYRARLDTYVTLAETMLARKQQQPRGDVRRLVEAVVAMGNGHALLSAAGVGLAPASELVGETLRAVMSEPEPSPRSASAF